MGDDHRHQQLAQPRPAGELVGARGEPPAAEREDVLDTAQDRHRAVAVHFLGGQAGGRDEDELGDPGRELDRHLGADEAAHRVADDGGLLDVELVEQFVDDLGVEPDRDVLGRHRRLAEARQVEGDHPPEPHEVRDVLQPVLP